VIDWAFPPELQKKYDEVVANNRRLQALLGIKPMTLEERRQAYLKRKAEELQRQEELKKLAQLTVQRRPVPKWKV
jgi:hypothetical protein